MYPSHQPAIPQDSQYGGATALAMHSLDLSFPVPYLAQQRFLELADLFLASDSRDNLLALDHRKSCLQNPPEKAA